MEQEAGGVVVSTARARGTLVTAAGELDAAGAIRLQAQLDDAVTAGGRVSLDLSRVTHVSADALAVLVGAYSRLRDTGGGLVIAGASPAVVRVLRISGLHRVLPVEVAAAPVPEARTS